VLEPALVLADEPTAHLDTASTRLVVDELRRAAAGGSAVVAATHDPLVMDAADRLVGLRR
jgi:ABC-type lipoprotein export system ATPase subunit